ncbi:MAG: hypothetical protein E7378_03510 [Clostridiales bacterium]|nr:hypothetical protein [Clostridiales bacterium]
MKKQAKLFATIGSLALSLALLAFGVYAAGAVTFNVTNTVTYTFDSVLVGVDTTLYRISSGTTTIVDAATVDALGADSWTATEDGVTDGDFTSYTGSDGVYTQKEQTVANSTLNFDLNKAFAYKVEIAFTTVSNSGVTISYNDTSFVDPEADDNVVLTIVPGSDFSIVPGETYTFVYYVTLEDATKEANLTLPGLSFTVNQA